ncbi:MAG: paeninodin family lasso peptide [Candidatus Sericytochromatia bacterium]
MKKEWKKPVLEIIDISEFTKAGATPPNIDGSIGS